MKIKNFKNISIDKLKDHFRAKIYTAAKQKIFKNSNYDIKYILEKNKSKALIIIFSGCTRPGIKARYNYMNTLKNYKVNKLFILDDFGYDKRGAYYFSHKGDITISLGVKKLINFINNELGTSKMIFIGSSKGGWASLFFGLDYYGSTIIAGAPQYLLGTYLGIENSEKHIYKYIQDDKFDSSDIGKLDGLIENKIKLSDGSQKIYLNCSVNDHIYGKHVKHLKNHLKEKGLKFHFEEDTYDEHGKISIYFPKFLKNVLQQEL